MCCRYWMEESPELRPFVEAVNRAPLKERMISKLARPLKTSGEIRPTDMVPVVAPDRSGSPVVYPMVWGFSNPKAGSPIVNARVETASSKPMWREAWSRHRCIVPASWYFEWEHFVSPDGKSRTGTKYMIQPKGCQVTYLAGLYRIEEIGDLKYPVFTILTREPSDNLRQLHDRMPLILPKDSVRSWISPETDPKKIIGRALTDMVFEKAV